MFDINTLDNFLCKINIRPIYKGRKANSKLANIYNGKIMVMKAMWCMEDDGKYPGEWAMVPADNDEWIKMCEVTAWIASGDIEILNEIPTVESIDPVVRALRHLENHLQEPHNVWEDKCPNIQNAITIIDKNDENPLTIGIDLEEMSKQGGKHLVINTNNFAVYPKFLTKEEIISISESFNYSDLMKDRWKSKEEFSNSKIIHVNPEDQKDIPFYICRRNGKYYWHDGIKQSKEFDTSEELLKDINRMNFLKP